MSEAEVIDSLKSIVSMMKSIKERFERNEKAVHDVCVQIGENHRKNVARIESLSDLETEYYLLGKEDDE